MKKPKYYYRQSGVIPIKIENGEIKVFIIKSRKGKKWILPKGILEPNKTYMEIAALEAFEEAGLKGKIFPQKIDTYKYKKWKSVCKVNFYIMTVEEIYNVYPEDFRKRKLVSIKKAKKLIADKKIYEIIKEAVKKIYSSTDLT